MKTKKLIGFDVCPDCEGNGQVRSDTADMNCPSCLGEGYVAFDNKGYYPYDVSKKRVAEVKIKWHKVILKEKFQLEEITLKQ